MLPSLKCDATSGVETQRQWSELAIESSTFLLMGLVSIICLLAKPLFEVGK
jgi:hypothetical protein